jgi:hypothetical protein
MTKPQLGQRVKARLTNTEGEESESAHSPFVKSSRNIQKESPFSRDITSFDVSEKSESEFNGGFMRFGPFLGLALLLLILWAGGFLFFHVAGFLIHLLLIFAVISLVIHLFGGSTRAA